MNTAHRVQNIRRIAQPVPVTPRRGVALTGGLCVALMACAAVVQLKARATELPATASWAEEHRFANIALEPAAGHQGTGLTERGAALVTDGDRSYVLEGGALEPAPAPALAMPAGFVAEGKVSGVRLAQDGRSVAWAGSVRDGRTERSALVVVTAGQPNRVVSLANADVLTQGALVSVDTATERVELADAAGSCLTLDFDGQILTQSLREASAATRTVQLGAAGRAVWTEGRGAALEWSTIHGSGAVTMERGVTIASVSISSDGKRIAYTTQAVRAGSCRPAVVVVDCSTGAEQLRLYPGQSTVRAAFLGASRLAVSVAGGATQNLVVLRVPGA